jgi:quercetin dioxygenase-like cupin family protein
VDKETAPLRKGDALPVRFNEVHSIANDSPGDLELMIVGIARVKWALDSTDVAAP